MIRSITKKKKPHLVCYFQRSRLSVFLPDRGEVATLDFPPTILADVTVVDQEQFKKTITKLLAQYNIEPSPVLVVLGKNSCFVTEIAADDKRTNEEVMAELRMSMPYTNVFVRIIHQGKKKSVLALNREFYEPLLDVFTQQNFEVTTLIPELILSQSLEETGLTPEAALELAAAVPKLEEFDLLEVVDKPKLITTTAQTPEDKKRTIILVSVFVVLILLLIGVWWWTTRVQPVPVPIVPVIPVTVEQPGLASPTPEVAPESTASASDSAAASATTSSKLVPSDQSATKSASPAAKLPLDS